MSITIGRPDSAPLTPEVASLHEAAHAVVATMLGLEVSEVYLTSDGHGMTEIYSDTCSETDYRWAIVGCAGSVIENADWINEGDFDSVTKVGLSTKDLDKLFAETRQYVISFRSAINKIAAVLLKHKRMSGIDIVELIKKDNMRNTKAISNAKRNKKKVERQAKAQLVKQTRVQKKAVPALKTARVAVESVKRQESAAERLTKLQKQATKVKRQAMYVKPGFVTLTKKEITELSESDRAIYMAQKTKEDHKNDAKSETAKTRRAAPRKRTIRRELQSSIKKAQKIVDKANPKPTVVKAAAPITVSETAKKHSHKREIERRTRQAAKKAAKSNQ